jgi:hypothetical protein
MKKTLYGGIIPDPHGLRLGPGRTWVPGMHQSNLRNKNAIQIYPDPTLVSARYGTQEEYPVDEEETGDGQYPDEHMYIGS